MSIAASIPVPGLDLKVDALVTSPESPTATYVFAHGAGAGMEHAFMRAVSERLAGRGIAVVRYQFPYMQKRIAEGKRWGSPDPAPKLEATVAALIGWAGARFPGLPLFAGGKSLGGRMTSRWAAAAGVLPDRFRGLVFFGFPLHPEGKPGTERAAHLRDMVAPMLFITGDRDPLAGLDRLRRVIEDLGPRATLEVVAGADHGFHVLKRGARSDDEVLDGIVVAAADWMCEMG